MIHFIYIYIGGAVDTISVNGMQKEDRKRWGSYGRRAESRGIVEHTVRRKVLSYLARYHFTQFNISACEYAIPCMQPRNSNVLCPRYTQEFITID